MRSIIENYKTRYHSLNRIEKRKLVHQVYEKVIAGGARFLKKIDGYKAWVVVDVPIALQKVSYTMKYRKSIHKQLDANGRFPPGVGGPPPPSTNRKAPPPISSLLTRMPVPFGAPHLGGIPRIVSAETSDPLGASPSLAAVAGVPSAVSPVSSRLGGLPAPVGLGSLGGISGYPTTTLSSMAELEAQHLAAQRTYHYTSSMSAESRIGYVEEVRRQQEIKRQQIIRETQIYIRMGDALLGNPAAAPGISLLGTPGLIAPMHAGFPATAGLSHPPMTPAEVELATRLPPSALSSAPP